MGGGVDVEDGGGGHLAAGQRGQNGALEAELCAHRRRTFYCLQSYSKVVVLFSDWLLAVILYCFILQQVRIANIEFLKKSCQNYLRILIHM